MQEGARQVERMYQELGPSLLSYFSVRHRDAAQAEDLLQDTFVEALREPERLEAAVSPRAYLFGIARNLSRHCYRRARLLRLLMLKRVRETDQPAALEPPDERLESMREALAALPELQREVLELRLQQDLSYEEIAAVLRIPVGTVRSRLHNAVARLRETIEPLL
jgi:RNA polymerase sigma-70 factor, ECF subfamily